MENSLFTELSLIVAIVAVVSLVMRLLRQPLIMGYIISGVIVGPTLLNIVHSADVLSSFSSLGITLLLFIIGLGLNAGVIKSIGRVALTTSISVMIPLSMIGFLVARLLRFDMQTAMIIAVCLLFSSTIIILKTLSDNKETSRLYGQIATGVLLIEDVVASLALVLLVSLGSSQHEHISSLALAFMIAKALGVGIGLYIAGRFILPHVTKWFAGSQEALFLFTVGWGLFCATIFGLSGLSYEVGALFAGVSLAGLPYATEMASKLKPLRDFFIVLFFVGLGATFTVGTIMQNILLAIALALVIIVGKPFLVLCSLGIQRYTRLTNFKTAIHLSQMSEFSIIFVTLAASKHVVPDSIASLIVLVAFISIGISTYLMQYSDWLYQKLEKSLRVFERRNAHELQHLAQPYTAVLVGYHKGGHEFLKLFRELRQRYLVVDYDPEIIDHLESQGIRHAYGDVTDEEFLEEINLSEAKLIVSVIDDFTINRGLLHFVRRHNPHASFICHAETYEEATLLYQHGASYVTLPHYIGSERISSFIKNHGLSHDDLRTHRERHLHTIGKKALEMIDGVG